jgi:hypothetical protein
MATVPTVTACHVRGLATPFATYTTGPTGARSAGASLGLTLQGVPLVREWCSFRSPCPPDVADRPDPRGGANGSGRLQGLVPATSPCCRRFSRERPDRRCLPGLLPSRVFSPFTRAIACSHDAGPLVLGWDDVPTRLDHRASRIEWIGMVRFRTTYSPGVLHLATVTVLRSVPRGAGSWLCLTQGDTPEGVPPTAIQAPSTTRQSRILGPRPGTAVHRCSTGHLVRSSALVFS